VNLSGYEKHGGSAYSVPYAIHLTDDPEKAEYEVIQSWDYDDNTVYLVLGEWVGSWEEVEERIRKARYGV
jgi:hypothetical protein